MRTRLFVRSIPESGTLLTFIEKDNAQLFFFLTFLGLFKVAMVTFTKDGVEGGVNNKLEYYKTAT